MKTVYAAVLVSRAMTPSVLWSMAALGGVDDRDPDPNVCRGSATKRFRSMVVSTNDTHMMFGATVDWKTFEPGVWLVAGHTRDALWFDEYWDLVLVLKRVPWRIPAVSELFNAWAWVAWKVRQIRWRLARRGAA